ncbi:hypothetical protein BD560DRAFT_436634 [Blakeslea trispora]|nr:hypothetical protein BD560DRAFT_436634 [Blakeslea trispora]
MPLKKCLYNRALDSTKFSDEIYILISRMYQVLIDGTLEEPHTQALDLRTRLSYILGITPHASQRANAIANGKAEGSVSRPVGRPCKSLRTEYSSAVTKIVKNNNQIGYPNTVKAIAVALKDAYFFDIFHQSLLRHFHELNMRYKNDYSIKKFLFISGRAAFGINYSLAPILHTVNKTHEKIMADLVPCF